jgi:ribose transport system permease protein
MATQNPAVTAPRQLPKLDWRDILGRFGTIIVLALVCIAFAVANPAFFGPTNLGILLAATAAIGIVSGGVTVLLVIGDFDLSIANSTTLAGVIAVVFTGQHHLPNPYLGFAAGVAAATGVGLLNGLIVTQLRLPSFITTLAMSSALVGVIYGYGGSSVYSTGLPANFINLGAGNIGGITYATMLMVATLFLLWLMLEQTSLGRAMYMMGGNLEAARLRGVNPGRIRLFAFVLMGFLAGIGGIVLASAAASSSPNLSGTMLLDSIAAVFLGASVLRAGQFHIGGTVVGLLVLAVLSNGMAYVNIPFEFQNLAKGLVLIVGVAFSQLRRLR